MVKASAMRLGKLVAATLTGAWRAKPPGFDLTQDAFEEITPLLLRSGSGGLGWWRVREANLDSPQVWELRQSFRLYSLEANINRFKIEKVVTLLRNAGIEPILIKGWSAARFYPEQGMRPYGDIDICVREEQYQDARQELLRLELPQFAVDLHRGFSKLGVREDENLFARSQLVRVGETDIRILGEEDHLRVICFHLMREGAWRPLWLCDVAAAMESRSADFDWDYCLGERQTARPIACAIGLAHFLLSAEIDELPVAQRCKRLPKWLLPVVLNEWGSQMPSMPERHKRPMSLHVRRPSHLFRGLLHRWPNPIEATTCMNGPFNDFPRLPFQIGNALFRMGAFINRFPGSLGKSRKLQ